MNFSNLAHNVVKWTKSNSPEILTALGVVGVATTAYLAGAASYRAAEVIHEAEDKGGTADDKKDRIKERTKLVWKLYIPPVVSGAATVACIVGSSRASGARTAAAVTAYSLTERAFSEYKEKVVEQIGVNKEQKVRDELAKAKVDANPVNSKEVIITGSGEVLCCELYTHRYFRSDIETLRRVENEINHLVNTEHYVSLSEFYDMIVLPHTSESDYIGWNFEKLLKLDFTTVLSENGEPCLAFTYNYVKPLRE